MDEQSSRWNEIPPSAFTHERAALRHVREVLPDRHPFAAWSNFTFISQHGHIREVDLLVATPSGLHLVEIKNLQCRLSSQGRIWVQHRRNGSQRTFDNPLLLASQKAAELKSLLVNVARQDGLTVPFVSAAVFLAEPGMACASDAGERHRVFGPDR